MFICIKLKVKNYSINTKCYVSEINLMQTNDKMILIELHFVAHLNLAHHIQHFFLGENSPNKQSVLVVVPLRWLIILATEWAPQLCQDIVVLESISNQLSAF